MYRPANGKPPLYPENPNVAAVATDEPIKTHLPVLDLNDIDAIAEFVLNDAGTAMKIRCSL